MIADEMRKISDERNNEKFEIIKKQMDFVYAEIDTKIENTAKLGYYKCDFDYANFIYKKLNLIMNESVTLKIRKEIANRLESRGFLIKFYDIDYTISINWGETNENKSK